VDELPGYLENARIARLLEDTDLLSGTENMAENLLRCYRCFTENGFMDTPELRRVESWVEDMNAPV
jgi:hypothetical protein